MAEQKTPSTLTDRDVVYRYAAIFILAFILMLGSAYVFWNTQKEVNKLSKEAAISNAEYFISSVKQYRTFYSKTIVTAAKAHGVEITHDYADKIGALPLPATFVKDFGEFLNKGDNKFKVKLYSDQPFLWRKTNVMDTFELNALQTLKQAPTKPVWSFEQLDGESVLRYARADTLSSSCVSCHNNYEGTPKTDWKEGDVRGALEVVIPMSEVESASIGRLKNAFLMMLLFLSLMIGLLFFILKKLSNAAKSAQKSYADSAQANVQLQDEIKQREKASQSLRANEVKLRAIVDSVEEVIVVIDQQGVVTECNQLIEAVFGYTVDEVIGKNITLLMTGEHASNHDAYIHKFLQSSSDEMEKDRGDFYVMGKLREFYATRKNGEVFPIELFVNDARVDDNIMFTGTIRDITGRKKTEEIRETAHKAAIESAQQKSDFLANMSHEIRTPMNGVIGMTEILLLSDLDEEQQDLAYTVKESAAALLVIINDILDYSKIEAGKLEINKKTFNLLDMIEAALDLLATVAEKKKLEIVFFIDAEVPLEIESDGARLRQVIINLLNNALKFTDQGYVILHVERPRSEELKFSILDTGIGIPDNKLATLFDSFSQVDSSSSREYGGTGLGLAICKQLVNLLGGELGVSSTKNVGSTFWFTIGIPNESISQQSYIVAPQKVLMLNAKYRLSRYYEQQMLQWHMSPLVVGNANEFISKLAQEQFDVLLIDVDAIFLDYQDDFGVQSILQAVRQHCAAPILLYASSGKLQKLETLTFEGDVRLLSKPIKHSAVKPVFMGLNNDNAATEVPPEKPASTRMAETTAEKVVATPPYRVLLAEDNRVNQKVAVAILGKFNCEVIVAENGRVAVEKIDTEAFDIVFMDCQMPEMDGYEATTAIRQFEVGHQNVDIPIIAFTARAMKDDDKKCKDVDMNDYLSKPIEMDALKRVLQNWSEEMDKRRQVRLQGKGK